MGLTGWIRQVRWQKETEREPSISHYRKPVLGMLQWGDVQHNEENLKQVLKLHSGSTAGLMVLKRKTCYKRVTVVPSQQKKELNKHLSVLYGEKPP